MDQFIIILLLRCTLKPLSQRVHLIDLDGGLGCNSDDVDIYLRHIEDQNHLDIGGFYFDKMDTGEDVFVYQLVRSDRGDVDRIH